MHTNEIYENETICATSYQKSYARGSPHWLSKLVTVNLIVFPVRAGDQFDGSDMKNIL